MKHRTFIGLAVAALTLSLSFCGCGDKNSKSESKSDSQSASSSNRPRGKFSPKVTKDAAFALGVNLDKRQAFKVVDAYLDQFCGLMRLREEDVDELKGVVSRSKKELFADAPRALRKFLDERGLSDVDLHWAVISLEDLKVGYEDLKVGYDVQVYGLSVAIAGEVDLEKLIPKDLVIRTVRHRPAVVFKEMMLEGEKVWRIEPQDESILPRRELERAGIYPHVTSLDGQLLLAASSRNALVKLIRLYRQGKDAGDALGTFSAKAGELLHLRVNDVGERVRQIVSQSDLQEIAQIRPGADQAIKRLGALVADVKVSPDGMLQTSASLKAASEKDAEMIRTLAKGGLMKVRSQWIENPYVPREIMEMLGAVRIGGTDGEIKVQNVNSLLAFWHVFSSARLNADLPTAAINGRKLIMGIVQANIDRQGKADPLWPRSDNDEDERAAPRNDVSSKAYTSAADYFNALFDMDHYGTPQWNPAVDGDLLSTLGKNAVVRKGERWMIDPAGLDWCIAANITDDMQDFMPVLVSANVNPVMLDLYSNLFDGKNSSPLEIGPKRGAPKSMFGDQAIVVVRKSGAAESLKRNVACYNKFYRQSFDYTSRANKIVWLTPAGR